MSGGLSCKSAALGSIRSCFVCAWLLPQRGGVKCNMSAGQEWSEDLRLCLQCRSLLGPCFTPSPSLWLCSGLRAWRLPMRPGEDFRGEPPCEPSNPSLLRSFGPSPEPDRARSCALRLTGRIEFLQHVCSSSWRMMGNVFQQCHGGARPYELSTM